MGKGREPFMFRKYDMIRAFDAGSYSYIFFFTASKGEILSFSYF